MIRLRPAEFADHTAIAKLHADNWRLSYRGIMSDNYLDNEVEIERLETWYKKLKNPGSGQFVTIAESENNLIGFCCLIIDEDPVFGSYIENLHVSSSQQKHGIGKMMISNSANIIAKMADSSKMYLWVYEANTNARIAYEKMGATNFETIDLLNEDGTIAPNCRYTWDDISSLKA